MPHDTPAAAARLARRFVLVSTGALFLAGAGLATVRSPEARMLLLGLAASLATIAARVASTWAARRAAAASTSLPSIPEHILELERRLRRLMDRHAEQERIFEEKRRDLDRRLRRRARALHRVNRRLRRLARMRDEFVSLLAHELRTPLAAVASYAEILDERHDELSDEERREFLGIVRRQVERIVRLVDEMLDVSRLRADRLQFEIAPLDLRAGIDEAVRALAPRLREAGVRVEVVAQEPVRVAADQDRLSQILANLLSNACKYASGGGRLLLRIGREERRGVLWVRDFGPGVPPEHLTDLFEPFFRVPDDRHRDVEGTGLGLYLSREFARRMGGDLSYEPPDDGPGACFVLELPLAAAGEETDAAPSSSLDPAEVAR